MDALEEAQSLMVAIQGRVSQHELISGEAALQMLDRFTQLAIAEQLHRIGNALDIMIMQLGNKPR